MHHKAYIIKPRAEKLVFISKQIGWKKEKKIGLVFQQEGQGQ
jgi:hypothetical protein